MKNNWLRLITVATVLVLAVTVFFVMQPVKVDAGLAKTKFLGNIIASSVPSNWTTYWNQVTPENGGKWGSVQSQPGSSYNWSQCDIAYNFARQNGFKFRYHCLVWGQQQPSNVTSASQVQTWINAVASRYGSGSDFVDVVNEPLHAVPSYSGVLGGNGSTGWDWVVKAFEYAHNAFPSSAQLCLNDYGIISDPSAASRYVGIANAVKSKGYLDGIGIQCHHFNMDTVSTSTMRSVLNTLAGVGVPIYVTELDMTGDDATQKARYQEKFPVLWEHPNVAGVTLWGYIEGQTWRDGTWLILSNGQERPAMQWLRQYFNSNPATPTPTVRLNTPTPTRPGNTPTPTVRPNTPTPTRPGTTPSGNYVVTYVIQSDWGVGATIGVTIKNNTTATVNGWTLAFTFPGNQTITNLWNGTYTQSGASVSVKDAGYNANIPANGGSVNFGFNLSYSGTNAKPTSFTLNGSACTVQ
ncbi:MAG: endo-1,4-beta-xylanase [Firmicutes bacterium]|nr:endo-1,4-beta-xylanase [Bacillota bacterium]